MSLPNSFFDEIRARVTLSEVIGKRIKLTRAGREFKACCPFHNEKSPSFTINDQKCFYHCFGCGAHGDAIGFVMQHDNVPFMEAVEQLAALAGMQVPQQNPEDVKKQEKKKDLFAVVEAATKFFQEQLYLPENGNVMRYLTERGMTDETIQRFRLGYSPVDGDALRVYLARLGIDEADMIESGVMRKSTYGNKGAYSFFRERLMFPVSDLRGRVVAFGGRILPPQYGGPVPNDNPPPKYINSSDNPLFHKGRMLYAQSLARETVRQDQPLCVVEGYMDVISLAQNGVTGGVAPLGTALTEMQITELWKMIPQAEKTPYLCFDGDNAGRRAAMRAMERALPLLKPDHSLQFVFLPEGEDPDSLVQRDGSEGFFKLLGEAKSLMDMLWLSETEGRDLNRPEAKAGLHAALDAKVAEIEDPYVQKFYQQEIKDRVYQAFNPYNQRKKGGGNFQSQNRGRGKFQGKNNHKLGMRNAHDAIRPMDLKPPPVIQGRFSHPHYLITAILNYPKLFDRVEERLGMIQTPDAELDNLRQNMQNILFSDDLDSSNLISKLQEEGFTNLLDTLLNESLYRQAVFVKPGHSLETVQQGWDYTWERYRLNIAK